MYAGVYCRVDCSKNNKVPLICMDVNLMVD